MSPLQQMAGALMSWRDRLRELGQVGNADHVDAILAAYGPIADDTVESPEQALTTSVVRISADRPATLYNALLIGGAEVGYPYNEDGHGAARCSVVVAGVRIAITGPAARSATATRQRLAGELAELEVAL